MGLIKISVTGHTQVARNLRVFASRLDQMAEFYQEALDIVEFRIDDVFSREGSNVQKAEPWEPLAESTLKARARGWGYYKNQPSNPSMLRWTGTMQDNRTRTITDNYGVLRFPTSYAIYHQNPYIAGRPPRRVIIDIDNPTIAEIVRALQTKINRDMGISGLQA